MNLCLVKLLSCKKVTRQRLYKFCDEQNYLINLTRTYIYDYLESKLTNKKKEYNENINKYVGKIANHLKINKENSNIIFSLQKILDIFFFNYFEFNYKSKLIFLYTILNTKNGEKDGSSLSERIIQEKKKYILKNLCKILLQYDIYYVNEIRQKYITKFIQIEKDNKKDYFFFQKKEIFHSYSLVPFNKKTFMYDLVNNAQNLKDLSILIYILRNIFTIYKIQYSKLLDKVLRKFYLYFKELSLVLEHSNRDHLYNYSLLPLKDQNKIEQTQNIKTRDIIYSFYQLTYINNNKKYQFLFLKILAIVNKYYMHIHIKSEDQSQAATNATDVVTVSRTQNVLKNLFLVNKDIEQLFFLLNKNCYFKYYFVPLLVTHFYLKLFSLDSCIIYFHKLFKKNYKKNYMLFPVDLCPVTILSYVETLKKKDVKNYFHTFYQILCIKYLLKKKKTTCEIFNYVYNNYLLNNKFGYVNFSIFYKNIINKIITCSFNLYLSKYYKHKGTHNSKCTKIDMPSSFFKYEENYIYHFSKCKFFYLIYLKRIIKKRREINQKKKKRRLIKKLQQKKRTQKTE
ncbi:hypothetical protein MKS88_004065 [Plasmodium brasilianum]|uniref:Uncharacterized protein n=2 Tax=Plasmodium (Plasmodium) TaxID=418103 RepID=A0A1D3SNP9_PLAMA|nr:conserved Plasmodium protein, unknown function [Plasmodium malariae]KAI4836275.1 hypothetical protein MKS88_004065 [Plasmodium brasilianum]SCO93539.1 conserved Plasmodium protein, unknown function [Plasmodium malariae]